MISESQMLISKSFQYVLEAEISLLDLVETELYGRPDKVDELMMALDARKWLQLRLAAITKEMTDDPIAVAQHPFPWWFDPSEAEGAQ